MKRRQGWSVVEFLIAITLGLLVALLASGLLVGTSGNYRNHSDNVWLSDSGRYALSMMAHAIRQAAYVNWDSGAAPPVLDTASVDGLDAASVSRSSDGVSSPLPPVINGSDVLALRFAGTDDGASVHCGGFSVPGGVRGWSVFYVAADADGEPELRCKYRGAGGWGADAVVRGIESFQVLYGVDLDTPLDGVPNTYLNATAVKAADAWRRVCSVKLALLLKGSVNSRADTLAARFDLFGATYADAHPEDVGVRVEEGRLPPAERLRARRIFSMTVALRNRDG
ncbi:PilW family protein [Duganella sp. sic0402]|uniref:PilW family protein n=1 Tax=Duganella sp. sic0402 TaxID=2854786 RepID=UPI001C483082|nr:PilW family protein [Duganella sp. sic0402]MBV7538980.1 PilW family protein [Duganella sp. sic0402]